MAEKKPETITWISRCVNQRLTIEPALDRKNPATGLVEEHIPGVHAQFEDHVFTTDDPRINAALKNHRLLNQFSNPSGFWREDSAPDEPKPTVKEQVAAVIAGLKADDRKAVDAVLIAERSSHNRQVVLEAGEDALKALGDSARPSAVTVPEALKE